MMKLNYFNFKKFNDQFLLTNDFGEYVFLPDPQFRKLTTRTFSPDDEVGQLLLDRHMVYDGSKLEYSALQAEKLRSYKRYLNTATALHIFVVTTACNMRCIYCQANNGVQQPNVFMTKEIAEKSVDIALQSPAKYLSFEFQGGEPLLNFDVIKHIVLYTEDHKADHEIEYNLVSNLTLLTDEMLDFLQNNNVHISTSIDGQRALHDCNRPFPDGRGTFDSVRDAINRLRNRGIRTGAIQTTTKQSLSHAKNIVDAYISLGFDGVFVRPLTPLGKALRSWDSIGYEPGDFVAFYSELLRAVLDANRKGYYIREEHAAMLMRKIGGCSVNYMELRSPCGAGIGQLAYFADGNVFTCDEGRMLFEMGNDSFYLGNVFNDRYADLIGNSTCKAVCASSVLETIPSCCDCVYQPYCGTCPVVSFALRNDIIEKQPRDYKCLIYMGIFDTVFALLQEGDPETVKILESWGN